MSHQNNTRRAFIRNAAILSAVLAVDPLKVFAANKIEVNQESLSILAETQNDFTKFSKQYSNYKIASSLSFEELQVQFNGMVKISSVASKPSFQSLSPNKKVKKIKDLNAFSPTTVVTKADNDKFYESVKEGRDAVLSAMAISGVMYQGSILLGQALSPALYTLALPPIIGIPMFIGTTGMAAWGVYDLIGNDNRNKNEHKVNIMTAIETLGANVYDKYLIGTDFNFSKDLEAFRFNVSSKNLNFSEIYQTSGTKATLAQRQLVAVVRAELSNSRIFTDKAELAKFLDTYVDKLGAVQKESIEKYLKSQEAANHQEALLQRDKAALYRSINAFVGNAINNMASPQEAKVLNILIDAGFQFVVGGGMTPFGWAAIGINIAGALSNQGSGNSFEAATFKMLIQIQKQLNVIIEKIDALYQNQIEILKELRTILNEVIETKNLINTKFEQLNAKQNIIYQTILSIEQQNVSANFQRYNRQLQDELVDNPRPNRANIIHQHLQEIQSLALDKISLKPFTRFDTFPMSAQYLKDEIFFKPSNAKYNIPLYGSIGLVPVLDNYNPSTNIGQSNKKVLHPVEFYTGTKSIISWLMISKLNKNLQSTIVKNLLEGAESTRKTLNDSATYLKIQEKADNHFKQVNNFIIKCRSALISLEKIEFQDKTTLANKIKIPTISNPKLTFFNGGSMSDNNHWTTFYNNRNDNELFNLAVDLGIASIRTISSKGVTITVYNSVGIRDAVVGYKNNEISLDNILLDFDTNLKLTIKIGYGRNLHLATFENWSGSGAGGHIVRSTYSRDNYNNDWRQAVSNYVRNTYNKDINQFIPGFTNITINEFFNHLIGQYLRSKKKSYLDKIKSTALVQPLSDSIDGSGLSLMVLTKLNQLISSDHIISYEIDYFDELFLKEDIESALDFLGNTDFEKKGHLIYEKTMTRYDNEKEFLRNNQNAIDVNYKTNSIFFYKKEDGVFSDMLNPDNFSDFVTIILNQELKSTISKCLSSTYELSEKDGEPHLCAAINDLNGYKKLYLS